ncbi:MAG: hypothetical protein BWZ02_00903 [Lentisphaerae bacterium ADurb.BinA184]|nr:MAG: hypothetical protein BWZ02_00903 [Lentisphaerae bacterium ADurb.BinA184]
MSRLALNEDNSHFYFTRAGRPLTAATVDALVDQYAGTQVSHLLFCPNSMRTSYASRVWDPIWRGYDPQGPDEQPLLASLKPEARSRARGWIHTAWALDQAGIDVYARWIAAARRHGISPWLSMRMNDVHNVDDERCYIHSEFWRGHPELRRVPYRFAAWTDRAFDYGQEAVREHHFRLIEELAERYDPDGLELDWMRFGHHFRPGHEAEGAALLTGFTRRVRQLLDAWERRRGHRIRLGARVPSRPQTALGLGMDAVGWARQGMVDWLVVTPFWASAEPDMPVEEWRELLRGTGVELCAGLEVLLRPSPGSRLFQANSLDTVRGAALSLLHRGADRIYLFNYMDSETTLDGADDYPRLLREIGDPAEMARRPRRHVLTFSDTWAVGEPQAAALPATVPAGGWHAFRLPIGPRPAAGDAFVALAFDPAGGLTGEAVAVRLNGEPCGPAESANLSKPSPEGPAWRCRVPPAALRDGTNVVELLAKAALTVTWVELDILPAAG